MNRVYEAGMYLREVGSAGSEPSLLFIHGLGESGLCFEHLLDSEKLDGRHLLVPDLIGYGRSPWPAGDALTLSEQADHLATWLRVRESGPVTVVGHSMGGVVALLLAEDHPDLVARVVDVDGNKSLGDCTYSSMALEYGEDAFMAGGFDTLRAGIYDRGGDDEAHRGYYASLRLADPRAFHLNSRELVEMSRREDMAARLAALALPATYVAGVPEGASPASRTLLADAGVDVREVGPAGHWPFIDQPKTFLQDLVSLLL